MGDEVEAARKLKYLSPGKAKKVQGVLDKIHRAELEAIYRRGIPRPVTIPKDIRSVAAVAPDFDTFARLDPRDAEKVMVDADARVQTVTRVGTQAQIKQLEQAQIKVHTKLLEQTATKLALQNMTAAQIQEAVQTQLARQLKTITSPAVKTQVKTQVKQFIPSSVKLAKPSVGVPSVGKAPAPKTPKVIKPVIPEIPRGKAGRDIRRIIRKTPGSITWRMGELHGQDRYDVLMPPYDRSGYYITVGKPPPGAVLMRGPQSAFRSVTVKTGKEPPDKTIFFDTPGIMAVKIEPIGGERKVRISFVPDAHITGKKQFPLEKVK